MDLDLSILMAMVVMDTDLDLDPPMDTDPEKGLAMVVEKVLGACRKMAMD